MIGHAVSSMSAKPLPSILFGLHHNAYVVVGWKILGLPKILTLSQGPQNIFNKWQFDNYK
jgi:hypothetical protein